MVLTPLDVRNDNEVIEKTWVEVGKLYQKKIYEYDRAGSPVEAYPDISIYAERPIFEMVDRLIRHLSPDEKSKLLAT